MQSWCAYLLKTLTKLQAEVFKQRLNEYETALEKGGSLEGYADIALITEFLDSLGQLGLDSSYDTFDLEQGLVEEYQTLVLNPSQKKQLAGAGEIYFYKAAQLDRGRNIYFFLLSIGERIII